MRSSKKAINEMSGYERLRIEIIYCAAGDYRLAVKKLLKAILDEEPIYKIESRAEVVETLQKELCTEWFEGLGVRGEYLINKINAEVKAELGYS